MSWFLIDLGIEKRAGQSPSVLSTVDAYLWGGWFVCHRCSHHLCSHVIDLHVVGGLDRSFNSQHFTHGVFVSMFDFEFLPCLPKVVVDLRWRDDGMARRTEFMGTYAWITHLRAVWVDSSCSIDFTEFPFQISITKTHLPNSSFFFQGLDRFFVDIACGGDALHFPTTFNVNVKHLNEKRRDHRCESLSLSYLFFLFWFDGLGCSFVDLQRSSIETMLLFELSV